MLNINETTIKNESKNIIEWLQQSVNTLEKDEATEEEKQLALSHIKEILEGYSTRTVKKCLKQEKI